MANLLNRYREVDKCKEDIQQFLTIASGDIKNIEQKDAICIIKNMMFIKKTYSFPDSTKQHYYDCLITDILTLIHTYSQKSIRVYYTTYRSLIENLVRVILRYDNTNATGVRNMFQEFRSKYDATDKAFIDYIEGEYGKCCNVVHSNYKAHLTMYEYYEEIVNADELSIEKLKTYARQLADFYIKCKKFIINNDVIQVDNAFHNQREVLKYLIGNIDYGIFLRNIKIAE